MVCPRCVLAVKKTLERLNIPYSGVRLGEAVLDTTEVDMGQLNTELQKIGFEIIQRKNDILVEQIKILVIDFIRHQQQNVKTNFSRYLREKTEHDYAYLSKIFSETEHITIEKYVILQKIERVKELISYGELNFSEIALMLHYSSSAYLAKQFKSITGMTLSEYKKSQLKPRKNIDKLR